MLKKRDSSSCLLLLAKTYISMDHEVREKPVRPGQNKSMS